MDKKKIQLIVIGLIFILINLLLIFELKLLVFIIVAILEIALIFFVLFHFYLEKKHWEMELQEVTYYVDKHGADIFTNMPIGIVAINSSGIIRWANKFIEKIIGEQMEMRSIDDYFPDILEEEEGISVQIDDEYYDVYYREGALYFFNSTRFHDLLINFNNDKLVMGLISFDNYEEFINSLDSQKGNDTILHMTKLINNWSNEFNVYLKKYSSNKYLLILNEETLSLMINDNFSILDDIRNYGEEMNLPLTLSMSFAHDIDSIIKLGEVVQEGLDLVLSRGGDQVVVKKLDGKSVFYGGKTDAVAKRNRVKARMFSKSIANLIANSKDIVLITHFMPDFDAIGALVGMSKIAMAYGKKISVGVDLTNIDYNGAKLLEELKASKFYECIKSEKEILETMDKQTLLIVVDTHRQSLIEFKEVLGVSKNTVIIDHHRRGDEFIENPIATYVEPYASSTCELVSELIRFQDIKVDLLPIEASAMLAGIIVDTKHFVYRTGNRTFDAAAFLKSLGADTILIQDILKDEFDNVVIKNNLISRVELINNMAITYLDDTTIIPQQILAQCADELMEINGVIASFVVGRINSQTSVFSARSLGEVNVQMIAEKLGGGGHLTAAAAQSDQPVEGLYQEIKNLIGGNEDESDLS